MNIGNKNSSNNVNYGLAKQLLNSPNNEVVWRCFKSEDESKIFEYGYSSEFFGDGEGSMYGNGIYFFRKAQGSAWRVGTGGVGDKIMKCVIVNGFKDFLIFDKELSIKYYGSDNIMVQLEYLFGNNLSSNIFKYIKYMCGETSTNRHLHTRITSSIMGDYTAPIAKLFSNTHDPKFGNMQGMFREEVKKSKVKGIIYSGGNDVWAGIVFNPRDVIPIAVTNDRTIEKQNKYFSGDFSNWHFLITDELYNTINNVKDFYIYGEKLKAQKKIRDYSKIPPQRDCLFVVLNNGNSSAFNVKTNKFVSEYGFQRCIGWEDRIIKRNGEEITYPMLPVVTDNKMFLLRYSSKDEKYYFFRETKKFKPYMTLQKYDALSKDVLNESINNSNYLLVYHRTDKNAADGIFAKGFSKEYTGRNANVAGPGIYFTFSSWDSTHLTRGFGPFMLECRLQDGIRDFLIPQGCTVNGVKYDKSLIEQLIDLTYPKYKNEMYNRYKYETSTASLYTNLCLSGNLGKTRVRGIIYRYGSGIAGVAADWGSMIAYKYSTDDGRTWHNGTDENKINFIKNHGDAKFALNKFISDGIIEDTFGREVNSIAANQQYNQGFLRVILRKNKKISFYSTEINDLISYVGFDKAIAPEVKVENGEKIVVIPVVINNENYEVREMGGQYVLYKECNSYEGLKLDDGTPLSTEIYDEIMNGSK